MQVQGLHREGIATPYSDPKDVAQYVKEFIDLHGMDATRRFGIRIHGDRKPTLDEQEAGVEGTVVIEIELADGESPVR